MLPKLGPDGKKITNDSYDLGGLNAGLTIHKQQRLMLLDFGTILSWATMSVEESVRMADLFRNKIKENWGDLDYNVEELPIKVIPDFEKNMVRIVFPQSIGILAANPEVYLAWAQRLHEAVAKLMEINNKK